MNEAPTKQEQEWAEIDIGGARKQLFWIFSDDPPMAAGCSHLFGLTLILPPPQRDLDAPPPSVFGGLDIASPPGPLRSFTRSGDTERDGGVDRSRPASVAQASVASSA